MTCIHYAARCFVYNCETPSTRKQAKSHDHSFTVALTIHDYGLLQPGQWLNDKLIDDFDKWLHDGLPQTLRHQVLVDSKKVSVDTRWVDSKIWQYFQEKYQHQDEEKLEYNHHTFPVTIIDVPLRGNNDDYGIHTLQNTYRYL
uniref:Uncharacterized protein n=1 Tax=Glossina pallidipes TaxID=7398 RepID=A0A1B0A2G0_GLOPL